jgi:hypothetical protein
MKYSIIALFFLFALILSCQNEGKAPVSAATFANILTDMHIAEAAAEGEFTPVKDSILKIYMAQILTKHGVSRPDFDSTLTVYSRQPVAFDSVYAQVFRQIQKIDTTQR